MRKLISGVMMATMGLGLVACESREEVERVAVPHQEDHAHDGQHDHEGDAAHSHDEPETEAYYGEEATQNIEANSADASSGHEHDGETSTHPEHHDEPSHDHTEDTDGHQH